MIRNNPILIKVTHWNRHGEDTHLIGVTSVARGGDLIHALCYDNTEGYRLDSKGRERPPADFERAQYLMDRLLGVGLEFRDDEGLTVDWGEVRSVPEDLLNRLLDEAEEVHSNAELVPNVPRDFAKQDEGGVV